MVFHEMPYFLQHFAKNWLKTLKHGTLHKKLLVLRRLTRFDGFSLTPFAKGALIWQRFTNVSSLRICYEKKRRDSFDPQRLYLLREVSICMVNLLEMPRMIAFCFFLLHD